MRLIDAEEVIKLLEENAKACSEPLGLQVNNIRLINKLPTAYDIDKVVEEEREEILNSNDYENEIINYCLDSFSRAIEIVEQGVR